MIVAGLIWILYGALVAIASPLFLLPDVALPAGMTGSIATAGNYLSILGAIIPLGTILEIVTFFVGIELSILTYYLIRWVYQKIPGVN